MSENTLRRLFISGGTVFFGKSLLDFFRNHQELDEPSIVLLSREPERFLGNCPSTAVMQNASFMRGDTREFESPKEDLAPLLTCDQFRANMIMPTIS